jgi:flagellar basal-body rod protein FlgB
MQLFDTTQLAVERALSGASLRNEAIAGNIANANTPGFVPRDVDFHSALASALGERGLELDEVRERLHTASFSPQADGTVRMRADGSGFDIDAQAAQLAANGLEYEALVAVAKGRNDILKSAIGAR